jgi:hypothetical protein
MKKIINLTIVLLTIGTFSSELYAQGEAAVPFLLITPGARNGGMGEGGVASATDANAVFWNPAGLAFQYENPEVDAPNEISLMHSQWLPQFNFNDLFYDYLAARFYVEGVGMMGGSITYLNLGQNVWMDEFGNELGTFDSHEFAVTISYATKLYENLGVGVNLKYVRSNLSDVSVGQEDGDGRAHTMAVDVGVQWTPDYELFENRLSFGANLSNLGPEITYIDKKQADPLPTNLKIGFAFEAFDDGFNKMKLIYDANRLLIHKNSKGEADGFVEAVFWSSWYKESFRRQMKELTHSVGMEYQYGSLLALRSGFFYEDPNHGARKFFTFGAGLIYNIFGIDFSYLWTWEDDDHPLADTIRFSISVDF